MKKIFILFIAIILSTAAMAQLEVKKDSFKLVEGFVNINTDKMYDENDKPYAVLKIKTENINAKQRRELTFKGDARTFFEVEYEDGEVWLYMSYYASYIKISHPDLSSTEFWFPFDMKPKCGYELTLVNLSESNINEEMIMSRLDELESATKAVAEKQSEAPTVIEVAKKDESYNLLTLNIAYNNYGKLSYGVTLGNMKKMGWFINAMSNFNFKGLSTDFECGNDFLVDGNYPFYTGKEVYTSLSAIGGVMFRLTDPIALRIGVGYGIRTTAYEMTDGKYVKNTDVSTSGVEVSAGAHYRFGKLVVSLDFVTTNFKYYEAKLGFGMGY
ncbi:MAG: hypothetical protein J6T53_00300 [Bacteroidales bacterium]|nr:hypothetical protein [Bacteroidales bacterium]